jgi:hypothetical protein
MCMAAAPFRLPLRPRLRHRLRGASGTRGTCAAAGQPEKRWHGLHGGRRCVSLSKSFVKRHLVKSAKSPSHRSPSCPSRVLRLPVPKITTFARGVLLLLLFALRICAAAFPTLWEDALSAWKGAGVVRFRRAEPTPQDNHMDLVLENARSDRSSCRVCHSKIQPQGLVRFPPKPCVLVFARFRHWLKTMTPGLLAGPGGRDGLRRGLRQNVMAPSMVLPMGTGTTMTAAADTIIFIGVGFSWALLNRGVHSASSTASAWKMSPGSSVWKRMTRSCYVTASPAQLRARLPA